MSTRADRIGVIEGEGQRQEDPRSPRERYRSYLMQSVGRIKPEEFEDAPTLTDRLAGEFGRGMKDEITLGHGANVRDQVLDINQAPEGTPLLEQLKYLDLTDVAAGAGRLVGALPGVMVTGGLANLGARALALSAYRGGAVRTARFLAAIGGRTHTEAGALLRVVGSPAGRNVYEGFAYSTSTEPFRDIEEGQSRARSIAINTGVGAGADFLLGAALPYARAPLRTLADRLRTSDNSVDREMAGAIEARIRAADEAVAGAEPGTEPGTEFGRALERARADALGGAEEGGRPGPLPAREPDPLETPAFLRRGDRADEVQRAGTDPEARERIERAREAREPGTELGEALERARADRLAREAAERGEALEAEPTPAAREDALEEPGGVEATGAEEPPAPVEGPAGPADELLAEVGGRDPTHFDPAGRARRMSDRELVRELLRTEGAGGEASDIAEDVLRVELRGRRLSPDRRQQLLEEENDRLIREATGDLGAEQTARAPSEPGAELAAESRAARARATEEIPSGERRPGVEGRETQIITGDDRKLPARYRVIEADDLTTSHNPETFQPNPRYPEGVQERDYHADRAAQEQTAARAQDLDPDRLLDPTFSPTSGPPQVTPDGIALGGNQRGMMLHRAIRQHPERFAEYRAQLEARAEEFGLDPEQLRGMKNPVLVREVQMEGPQTRDQLRDLGEAFNVDPQKAKGALAEAATRAAKLRRGSRSLGHLEETLEGEETVRNYLRGPGGRKFMELLIEDGVISPQEASRFRDPSTGVPTQEGFNLVENALRVAAIGDPDVVARAPKSVLNQIEHATPAIIRASSVEGYPVDGALRGALDILSEARSKGIKLRDLLDQTSMFDEGEANPLAVAMAQFLDRSNKRQTSAAFRRVAADALEVERGVGNDLFGDPPRSIDESIYTHMGGPDDPNLDVRGPIQSDRPGFLNIGAIVSGVKGLARRYFKSAGDLPQDAFQAKVRRDGWIGSALQQMHFTLADFHRSVRKGYGRGITRLSERELAQIDGALKAEFPIEQLPEAVQPVVRRMRAEVDALSQRMIDVGAVEGRLVGTVTDNLGVYMTRSYRKFDDPAWASKVPEDVRLKAKAWLRGEYPDRTDDELEALINELLFVEEGPMALIAGGKLGSKDLSSLIRRRTIPPELRALWGEYTDPRVNYTRSITKMAHLVGNHQFLSQVREQGLGRYFHTRPNQVEGVSYHAQVAPEGSPAMRPLAGLYTSEEILREFNEAIQPEQLPDYMRYLLGANSAAKFGKTVLSPVTIVRNLLGNVGFAVANGHWRLGHTRKSWQGVLKGVGSRDKEAWRSYYRRAQELGVVDESARAGELQDMIRDASTRGLDDWAGNAADRATRKGLRGATGLYRGGDDVWKIFAWENEISRYQKALGITREQAEEMTAPIVRDTYPTYSMVPRGIKNLRRFPIVGTFVSFASEVYRTSTNTIGLAMRELADPRLRGIGAQRLSGIIAAVGLIEGAVVASRNINGVTKEQDEDYRRFAPWWSENSHLFHMGKRPDGAARVIDLSYLDPHAYLRKPILAALRGDDFEETAQEAAIETLRPFFGEEIFAQAFREAMTNQRAEGGRLYNPEAPAAEKWEARLRHMLDALEPGAVTSAQRIWDGHTGKRPNLDPRTELIATTTGQRISTIDHKRSLGFMAREYTARRGDAGALLRRTAGSRRDVSEEQLEEAFQQSERARQRLFMEAHADAQAAVRLGMTERQVRRTYEAAGLSKMDARRLVRGDYRPYRPSGRFLEGVAESVGLNAEDPRTLRRMFINRRRIVRRLSREAEREGRDR